MKKQSNPKPPNIKNKPTPPPAPPRIKGIISNFNPGQIQILNEGEKVTATKINNAIRIISDGTPFGTKVFNHQGSEIKGIAKITMSIDAKNIMKANLEFINVQCSILADWSNHPLKQWANKKTGKS